ncbi:MAG: NblA/ycf18 family protein [Cyanobacteria bacterium J06639_1]
MNDTPYALTLEQQFKLRTYETAIAKMDLDQARACLRDSLRLMMVKDNAVKHLLKDSLNDSWPQSA